MAGLARNKRRTIWIPIPTSTSWKKFLPGEATGMLTLTRFSTATGSACSARRCRSRRREVRAEPLKVMNRLPQKISLVAQTASVLLEEIQGGRSEEHTSELQSLR